MIDPLQVEILEIVYGGDVLIGDPKQAERLASRLTQTEYNVSVRDPITTWTQCAGDRAGGCAEGQAPPGARWATSEWHGRGCCSTRYCSTAPGPLLRLRVVRRSLGGRRQQQDYSWRARRSRRRRRGRLLGRRRPAWPNWMVTRSQSSARRGGDERPGRVDGPRHACHGGGPCGTHRQPQRVPRPDARLMQSTGAGRTGPGLRVVPTCSSSRTARQLADPADAGTGTTTTAVAVRIAAGAASRHSWAMTSKR